MYLSIRRLLFIFIISTLSQISISSAKPSDTEPDTTSGYSALKLFLEDEQHLTAIRRARLILTFTGISESSSQLIDKISDSSEQAITDLEKLAAKKPALIFVDFSDDSIAKATLDSLRITAAKELMFESDAFEKNLLLGQLKILRVISHLAREIEKIESNAKRKVWLKKLADEYEAYYLLVKERISLSQDMIMLES